MSIRRQMITWIAGPTLVIYIAVLGLAMRYVYRQSTQEAQRDTQQLAASYAARFDGYLAQAAAIADTTARFLETTGPISDEQCYAQLQRNVQQSPLVYGACLAFEPGMLKPADVLFGPYVCRDGQGFRRVNIDKSVYDWSSDPRYTWFSQPKALGRGVWSEPYFDEGAGNILMTTWSAPFSWRGKFAGVATVDVDLPRLKQTVGEDFHGSLNFVILTKSGKFVYDRDTSRIMTKTIFDIAADLKRPELADVARAMLGGEAGMVSVQGWDSDERQLVCYAPIKSSGWIFACRFPESAILRDVRNRTLWSGAALGTALLLIVGCISFVSRKLAAPIVALKEKVLEVSKGNLEAQIDESARSDEIRQLAHSFNLMTSQLRSHVEHLAAEKAARERIERDLDIAREIQRSLLPSNQPSLPGYEITGWSRPAEKTGGDYYDWQTLPSGQTLISLADVTGHGVGPALVTAVCRAYVRAGFATGHDLAGLVQQLNHLLLADLPSDRFVTFVAVLLDPNRPEMDLISAGHGPTMLYRARDKSLTQFDAMDIPLGVAPTAVYSPAQQIVLEPGDFLLFLTDGLFEWQRPDGEQFGLARLRQTIIDAGEAPFDQIIPQVHAAVQKFANGVPQADDITAIVLRRKAD